MLGVFFTIYFIVISKDQTLLKESEAAVQIDVQSLQNIYDLAGIDELINTLELRVIDASNNSFYALKNRNAQLLLSSLGQWPVDIKEVSDNGMVIFSVRDEQANGHLGPVSHAGKEYDVLSRTVILDNGFQLFVGRNVDDLEIAQWVGRTFGWLIVVVLCLIASLSLWVGYYVVSRINAISDTANQIMNTGDLSARLPVESTWDDLSKLAVSLNRMLEEIEQLVGNIQSVSDNIAHDLRTPLTRMRQHIESQFEPHTAEPLLNEADNLLSMFNGLLRIADVESDKKRSAFKRQGIKSIIEDVIELYQPLAEEKAILVSLELQHADVFCDRDLIFQCMANILDNAIKFTPCQGKIAVSISVSSKHIIIQVNDNGIGISADKHSDITRRFYRADKSRTSKGNGLGMAMVAAIVDLHNGELFFTPNPMNEESGLGVSIHLLTS
jgi:signal transduction histidine kinase